MSEEKIVSIYYYMTHKQTYMYLTFIGGFVDTVGYVMLFHLFTASITGNIVSATIPIYRNTPGFAARAVTVLGMGLGAGCITMYSMKLRFASALSKWQIGFRMFMCELIMLIVTMVVGASQTYHRIDSTSVFITASCMAFSMGIQNAVAMTLIPNCPATTGMTGNTIRLFIYGAEALNFWLASHSYVDLFHPSNKPINYDILMKQKSRELTKRFRMFLSAVLPFTIGAISSVPLANTFGFWCLALPIGVVLWILFCINHGSRRSQTELPHSNTDRKVIEMDNSMTISPLGKSSDHPSAVTSTEEEDIRMHRDPSFRLIQDICAVSMKGIKDEDVHTIKLNDSTV